MIMLHDTVMFIFSVEIRTVIGLWPKQNLFILCYVKHALSGLPREFRVPRVKEKDEAPSERSEQRIFRV